MYPQITRVPSEICYEFFEFVDSENLGWWKLEFCKLHFDFMQSFEYLWFEIAFHLVLYSVCCVHFNGLRILRLFRALRS